MMKNRDIIYFANNWDADNKTSSHQIAALLAIHNRVLYVESGGLRAPSASGRDIKRIFSKIWRFIRGSREVGSLYKEFRIISLFLIPLHQFRIIHVFNKVLTFLTVRFYMAKFGIKKPVVFFFFPHLYYLCGRLSEDVSVYYCIDDYSSFPGVNRAEIKKMDEALSRQVDAVFVVSEELIEEKRRLNKKVYYSPHGVDIEHFSPSGGLSVPKTLAAYYNKKPLILYWGLIAEWMDVELIEFLLERHPDKQFVFIGRSSISLENFRRYANVSFLGPVDYGELPSYARCSDVLIIPFLINNWTKKINPIKLKEYLATGKPVISTAIPEAVRQKAYVGVARTYEEFSLLLINEAGSSEQGSEREKRLNYIKNHTWESRVGELSSVIMEEL